jgi:hypothetical protein
VLVAVLVAEPGGRLRPVTRTGTTGSDVKQINRYSDGSMRSLLRVVVVLIALACGNSKPPAEPSDDEPQPKVVSTDTEFTLRRGERAAVEQGALLITFLAVLSDSRCPADVVCVWQGDAAMLLRIESLRSDAPTRLDTLHTELQPRQTSYLGYTIRANELRPYPYSSDDPGSRDYRVSLTVTKGGGDE